MKHTNDHLDSPDLDAPDLNDDLDLLLGQHFQDELDPHLGRAEAHFAHHLAHQPERRIGWRLITSLTGLAALIALALFAATFTRKPTPHTESVVATLPEPALMELERTVAWQTFDEGTVLLEDQTPMRKLRRETLERVQYYDAEQQAVVEMTIPKQEVFLVKLAMY